jgi:hypothetical protein
MKWQLVKCIILIFVFMSNNPVFTNAQFHDYLWPLTKSVNAYSVTLDFRAVPVKVIKNDTLLFSNYLITDEGDILYQFDGGTIGDNKNNILFSSRYGGVTEFIVPTPGQENSYHVFFDNLSYGTANTHYLTLKQQNKYPNAIIRDFLDEPQGTYISLAILPHQNDQDYWYLTFIKSDNNYQTLSAYHLSSAGLNLTPVITPTPFILYSLVAARSCRYMGLSKQVIIANEHYITTFSFNEANGGLSLQHRVLLNSRSLIISYELSPDESKIYIATEFMEKTTITQYDMSCLYSQEKFLASGKEIFQTELMAADMKAGPDDKIYVGLYEQEYLAIIENPNSETPKFNQKGLYLEGYKFAGQFPSTYTRHKAIYARQGCYGNTSFTFRGKPIKEILWHFGDGITSTEANPVHQYVTSGDYTVKAEVTYTNGEKGWIEKKIEVNPAPANLEIYHK